MSDGKRAGGDGIDELIRELDQLKELDQRRNALAPGSTAHDTATLEIDLRSRRLMDRFRDLQERRSGSAATVGTEWTIPLDVRGRHIRDRGSLLN